MQVEYINPFLTATIKVLSSMAMTEAKPGKPGKKSESTADGIISAVLALTGGTNGSIALSFTESCIVGIVNNMLGEEYTALNDDIKDAVGEIVNMVSGEARRELANKGFIFQGSLPTILEGENHRIEHSIEGTVARIPFQTSYGRFSVEASFESEQYFEESTKTQKLAAVQDTNSSLTPMNLQCFLSKKLPIFKSYILKSNSQIMKPNFFLIPEYVGATEGNEFCNFTALEVSVCPTTFFATNELRGFRSTQNPTHSVLENIDLQKLLLPKLIQMREMQGNLAPSMYSIGRSVEDGVLAYNLAIYTSETLFQIDENQFSGELSKIGEYSLKAALLSKLEKSQEREKQFIDLALESYQKSLPYTKGEQYFRNCFRIVALSVYLANYTIAEETITQMVKYFHEHQTEVTPQIAPRVKRYIQLVNKINKERDAFSLEKHIDRTDYQFLEI